MMGTKELNRSYNVVNELVKKSWKGEEDLWIVFWLYGLVLGCFLVTIFDSAYFSNDDYYLAPSNAILWNFSEVLEIIIICFGLLGYTLWNVVSMWRCAFNAKYRAFGYFVRAYIVLTAMTLVELAYREWVL